MRETMAFERGSPIGHDYRIERTIAADRGGTVLAARRLPDRAPVTIKVMPDGTSQARLVGRFARASRIASPHVPRLFDVGSLPDGRPYVVMEYLEGESLRHVLLRGPLRVPDAVDYVVQACHGVAAGHAVGIVHRALKTPSLFLSREAPDGPRIKVLNFVAAQIDVANEGFSAARVPIVDAAPEFLAPEQLAASREPDARTDVWSLGVILYQLLTGTLPFAGRNAVKAVLEIDPKPLRKHRGQVTPPLEAVVLRCLEKSHELRWPNVSELAIALRPFASDVMTEVVASIPPPKPRREGSRPSAPPPARTSELPPESYPRFPDETSSEDVLATFLRVTKKADVEPLDAESAARWLRAKRVADETVTLRERASATSLIPPPADDPREPPGDEDGSIRPLARQSEPANAPGEGLRARSSRVALVAALVCAAVAATILVIVLLARGAAGASIHAP